MPDATTIAPAPGITTTVKIDTPRDTMPLAANDPARLAAPITPPAGPTPVIAPKDSLPSGITAPGVDAAKVAADAAAAAEAAKTKSTPAADAPADPNKPAARKTLLEDGVTAPPEVKKTDAPAPVIDPNAPKYDLKAPEKSLLTADDLKAIENYGREHKLAPEVAQLLVNRESKVVEQVRAATQVEARATLNKMYDDFEAQAAKDPDLAGPKFAAAKALANRALVNMPHVTKLLKGSPYGSDPAVLKDLAAIGKLLQEDKPIEGASHAGTDLRSPAERWFGTK